MERDRPDRANKDSDYDDQQRPCMDERRQSDKVNNDKYAKRQRPLKNDLMVGNGRTDGRKNERRTGKISSETDSQHDQLMDNSQEQNG